MRDVIGRAHPGLFGGEEGRTVVAAQPPAELAGEVEKSAEAGKDKVDAVPPEWAYGVEGEAKKDATLSEVDEARSIMASVLPFKDDIVVWEAIQLPRAHEILVELLDGELPDHVDRVTTSANYADHVVTSLFAENYLEEHLVPAKTDKAPTEDYSPSSTLPYVAKTLLAVLQTIAVTHKGPDFDINEFWMQVRMHFPEITSTSKGKPSATTLMQEGLAAVAEEDMAAKGESVYVLVHVNELNCLITTYYFQRQRPLRTRRRTSLSFA